MRVEVAAHQVAIAADAVKVIDGKTANGIQGCQRRAYKAVEAALLVAVIAHQLPVIVQANRRATHGNAIVGIKRVVPGLRRDAVFEKSAFTRCGCGLKISRQFAPIVDVGQRGAKRADRRIKRSKPSAVVNEAVDGTIRLAVIPPPRRQACLALADRWPRRWACPRFYRRVHHTQSHARSA